MVSLYSGIKDIDNLSVSNRNLNRIQKTLWKQNTTIYEKQTKELESYKYFHQIPIVKEYDKIDSISLTDIMNPPNFIKNLGKQNIHKLSFLYGKFSSFLEEEIYKNSYSRRKYQLIRDSFSNYMYQTIFDDSDEILRYILNPKIAFSIFRELIDEETITDPSIYLDDYDKYIFWFCYYKAWNALDKEPEETFEEYNETPDEYELELRNEFDI
jgi:hypothetical protein